MIAGDRPSSSIFERLAQPIIRKFRSTTVSYLPGVIYEDKKENKDSGKQTNGFPDFDQNSVKPIMNSETKCPLKTYSLRHTPITLKDLLSGRPTTLKKNKYLDYILKMSK